MPYKTHLDPNDEDTKRLSLYNNGANFAIGLYDLSTHRVLSLPSRLGTLKAFQNEIRNSDLRKNHQKKLKLRKCVIEKDFNFENSMIDN